MEPVSKRKRTKRSYWSQDAKESGTPQRGKKRVKICVRAECNPELTLSTKGELHESASSSGRKFRIPLKTAIARSGPLIATGAWSPKELLGQRTEPSAVSFRRE